MKKLFKPQFFTLLVMAFALFLTSCSPDDNGAITPNPTPDPGTQTYEIKVTPTNAGTTERNVKILAEAASTVKVTVNFQSDNDMTRLYITKNEYGSNIEEAYSIAGTSTKGDGSINVTSATDRKNITYEIPFMAPATTDGTVVYTLWMTRTKGLTSRGDFRDPAKRNAISENPAAVGLVVINAGTSSALSGNGFKSFSATMLYAPTGDKKSVTFMSTKTGKTYAIEKLNDIVNWDFGYYYGGVNKASFVATDKYDNYVVTSSGAKIFDLAGVVADLNANAGNDEGVDIADLNTCWFKLSSKSANFFDGVSTYGDLEFITKPADNAVTKLTAGKVVEFVDRYGAKGLIKIKRVVDGNNDGQYTGSKDFIEFDVKVQEKELIVNPFKG